MSTFIERAHQVDAAWKIAETNYLTSEERIAISRLNEIYESYKNDLDPNFQGISPIAWIKAIKEVPEGEVASAKLFDVIGTLLMSGKFGQIDWKI